MRACFRVGDVRVRGVLAGAYLHEGRGDLVFKLRCCPAFDDVPALVDAGCEVFLLQMGCEVHVPLSLVSGLCAPSPPQNSRP